MKPEAATGHRTFPGGWRLAAVAAIIGLLAVVAIGRQAFSAAAPPATPAARAYAIGERLACPICEGLSVADSPSALAQQMRDEIADQVAAGRSDAQIQQYFVARYGPAILLTPPKQGFTLLAWWVPVLFIVMSAIGIGAAAYRWSRRPVTEEALPDLSAAEEEHYAARLAEQLPDEESAQSGSGGRGGPLSGSAISPPSLGESQSEAIGSPSRLVTGEEVRRKEPSSQARSSPPGMGTSATSPTWARAGEGASPQPSGARIRP